MSEDYAVFLNWTVRKGDVSALRLLLEGCPEARNSVNEQDVSDQGGYTPLHSAAEAGKLDSMNLLLSCGAIVDARDAKFETPLHKAAEHGHVEIMQTLISKEADVNATEVGAWTPLHLAARWGNVENVQLLLEADADIEAVLSESQETPLHLAAWKGHAEVVFTLLQHGASTKARNKDGRTPIDLARNEGVRVQMRWAEADAAGFADVGVVWRIRADMRVESSDDDLSVRNGQLCVIAGVKNMAFEKTLGIRLTLDDWSSWRDWEGQWSRHVAFNDTDEFTILLPVIPAGTTAKYALYYKARGHVYWDNNAGANYSAHV